MEIDVEGFEIALEPGRVGDQILTLVPEHEALIAPYAPKADRQGDRHDQGHHRHRRGGDGDNPHGAGQLRGAGDEHGCDGAAQVLHRAKDRPRPDVSGLRSAAVGFTGSERAYLNVTGNESELLLVFFSPGTALIVATTVWVPAAGLELRVTWQVVLWPANVSGTIFCPLTPVPLTDTWQTTLVSLLVPPLVKLSVKVGGGLAVIEFVEPVWSVVPATLTESSLWPCKPGATLPELLACRLPRRATRR